MTENMKERTIVLTIDKTTIELAHKSPLLFLYYKELIARLGFDKEHFTQRENGYYFIRKVQL